MNRKNQAVRVFAPATVANVGVGYDILGFAIEGPGDEVVARWSDQKGLRIIAIGGTKKKLPREVEKNTAGYGALQLLKFLGKEEVGIDLEIYKKMPFGTGLGSSAASAAAGVMAVNELLGRPLEKKKLVKFAVLGESAADGAIHGDNAIPSLMGGIILIRDNLTCDFVNLPAPKGLCAFIIYPEIEILTKDARAVLSEEIKLVQHTRQAGNLGALIASLYTLDLDLMKRSLTDHIIEPQRASMIPHFYALQEIALASGAMNYTISGAGPSMFGFCQNSVIAEQVIDALSGFLSKLSIPHKYYLTKINTRGAFKM